LPHSNLWNGAFLFYGLKEGPEMSHFVVLAVVLGIVFLMALIVMAKAMLMAPEERPEGPVIHIPVQFPQQQPYVGGSERSDWGPEGLE
jgi:hypothetical protein